MRLCPRCLRSWPDAHAFCPQDGEDLLDADEASRNAANATWDLLPADLGKLARRNVFERGATTAPPDARAELEARIAEAEARKRQGRSRGGLVAALSIVGTMAAAAAIFALVFWLLG